MFKKLFVAAAVAAPIIVSSPSVFAADPTTWDYSKLTSGVDFTGIGVGVLAVSAVLASVYAGIKGAKIVLGFLR